MPGSAVVKAQASCVLNKVKINLELDYGCDIKKVITQIIKTFYPLLVIVVNPIPNTHNDITNTF